MPRENEKRTISLRTPKSFGKCVQKQTEKLEIPTELNHCGHVHTENRKN